MQPCAILLPAAGASQRMRGADKLLEQIDARPVLRVMTERATQASAHVAVTLPEHAEGRARALEGLPIARLSVTEAAEGMAASLRKGAAWALQQPVAALMIMLPDMPEITADDLRHLIAAQATHPHEPLRACNPAHKPGHPTIFPRALLAEFMTLKGDRGARALLQRHPPRLYPLPGQRAVRDLDTPEDWADWRSQRG